MRCISHRCYATDTYIDVLISARAHVFRFACGAFSFARHVFTNAMKGASARGRTLPSNVSRNPGHSSAAHLAALREAVPVEAVAGERYPAARLSHLNSEKRPSA
jgi:hypothetical protein